MAETILFECSECNATTHVVPTGSFDRVNPYEDLDGERYYFGQCSGCWHPVVMQSNRTYDIYEQKIVWDTPFRLYPVDKFYVNPAIPKDIQAALSDSIRCYHATLYTPTVIMCRRTLEGFCKTMNVGIGNKRTTLFDALKELKEKGVINDQLFQWASLLKDSGNKAAHDIHDHFTDEDAKDILDFTIAILDFTYSFKDKFDNFIKRQAHKEEDTQ